MSFHKNYHQFKEVYEGEKCSKMYRKLSTDCLIVHSEDRSGCPLRTDKTVQKIETLVIED